MKEFKQRPVDGEICVCIPLDEYKKMQEEAERTDAHLSTTYKLAGSGLNGSAISMYAAISSIYTTTSLMIESRKRNLK